MTVCSTESSEDGQSVRAADCLPAQPDIPNLLEEVRQWASTTPHLQQVHITGYPHITARLLILARLPPETPWKMLTAQLGLSIGTLSSFYHRQCMPLLRNFGESQGYF